ncbi:MAG: hypothetical protein U0V74_14245 [Chitinophagales bacterium]
MKRYSCFLFLLISAFTLQAQNGRFGIYLEQNGKRYDIVKNEVTLQSAPFDLVLFFPSPMGVFINASLEPFTYGPVTKKKSNKKKEDLIGFATTGLTEAAFNRDSTITISDNAPNYWYYDSLTSHSFNKVIQTDSGFVCKRHLKTLSFISDKKQEIIEGNMPALYLVLISTMFTKDRREIELMRAAVKINFVR